MHHRPLPHVRAAPAQPPAKSSALPPLKPLSRFFSSSASSSSVAAATAAAAAAAAYRATLSQPVAEFAEGARSCSSSSSSSSSSSNGKPCCDKCDGAHATDSCPHYKKKREDHPDAWRHVGRKPKDMGGDGGNVISTTGRVVRQPGDGSCLFHSLSYGLGDGTSASQLRRELAAFVLKHPDLEIADDPLKDWVAWDSNGSVSKYCSKMASGGVWGGGIEMAALSHARQVNVHVYQACSRGFKRISCFNVEGARKTVTVIYQGGVHYDALLL